MRLIATLVLTFALACSCSSSSDGAPTSPPRDPDPTPAPTPTPTKRPEIPDLPPDLDTDPTTDEETAPPPTVSPVSPTTADSAIPLHGCVPLAAAPTRLWPSQGPPAITPHATTSFLVAFYATPENAPSSEQLTIVEVSPSLSARPIRTFPIVPATRTARTAPPAILSLDPRRALVAFTDGAGALFAAEILVTDPGAPSTPQRISTGVDLRFAPALALLPHARLLAYTEGTTPMRVRLAYLQPGATPAEEIANVTPASASGAAPTFATGGAPTLYFVDAHAGISNILRVALADDGRPSPAEVARVVSNLPDAPQIAVARRPSDGTSFVGYVALGRLATTAVGLLSLAPGNTDAPEPIVPGTAYVPLHVSAASGPSAIVFAADAPQQEGGRPPRQASIRVLDTDGLGPPLTLRDRPEGDASFVSLARRTDGTYAAAFTSGSGVYAAFMRCADR